MVLRLKLARLGTKNIKERLCLGVCHLNKFMSFQEILPPLTVSDEDFNSIWCGAPDEELKVDNGAGGNEAFPCGSLPAIVVGASGDDGAMELCSELPSDEQIGSKRKRKRCPGAPVKRSAGGTLRERLDDLERRLWKLEQKYAAGEAVQGSSIARIQQVEEVIRDLVDFAKSNHLD